MGFGPSLPENILSTTLLDPAHPNRTTPGELITVEFKSLKDVKEVRLTAYSKAGDGSVLIRKVSASILDASHTPAQVTSVDLPELYDASVARSGNFSRYEKTGNVMLKAYNHISMDLNQTAQKLAFQVEGFKNNDTTLLIEVFSPNGFQYYDFTIHRDAIGSSGGSSDGSTDSSGSEPSEPPSSGVSRVRGSGIASACGELSTYESRAKCFREAAARLASYRSNADACTATSTWQDESNCFYKLFSSIGDSLTFMTSSRVVLKAMCSATTTWQDESNCFYRVSAWLAGGDLARRTCGDLSSYESRTQCFRQSL